MTHTCNMLRTVSTAYQCLSSVAATAAITKVSSKCSGETKGYITQSGEGGGCWGGEQLSLLSFKQQTRVSQNTGQCQT